MSPNVAGVVLAALGALGVVGAVFYVFGRRFERRIAEATGQAGEAKAQRLIEDGQRTAEAARAEAILAGKEEVMAAREDWDREEKSRREEILRVERRLEEREVSLDRRANSLEEREKSLGSREQSVNDKDKQLQEKEKELTDKIGRIDLDLARLAGMSLEEAKSELFKRIEEETKSEAAALVREMKEEAQKSADKEGKKILANAIQRISSEYASEISVSTVTLPSDEMKGRIIGREGRNIRAFETATGVDVIIDDTPDTVVVSCFDPVRREVARVSMEQLITDGRIHPGRIEEIVTKVKEELEQKLVELGEQAAYELGIHGMHQELLRLVGRMKYRTSYGQNMYEHSKEVSWLAGIMATELGLDVHLAKRGALLHDVGKVLTHQHEGTHVELGVEMAKKYGEGQAVINCIAAHHDDVPHESAESVIVQAADSASGARPGARREAFESYVKRLTRIEEIANSFPGVEKTYAIQAGREVRIVVSPDRIKDEDAAKMSDEIARKIEDELQYPGQIKVVVIRETRAVDFAR